MSNLVITKLTIPGLFCILGALRSCLSIVSYPCIFIPALTNSDEVAMLGLVLGIPPFRHLYLESLPFSASLSFV